MYSSGSTTAEVSATPFQVKFSSCSRFASVHVHCKSWNSIYIHCVVYLFWTWLKKAHVANWSQRAEAHTSLDFDALAMHIRRCTTDCAFFYLFIYLFIYLLCIYLFTYLLFIYLLNYLFIYLLIYYLFIIYLFIHSSKCPNIFFIYLFANNLDLPFFFTYNYANRYSSIELDTFLAIEIKDRSHHLITYRSCFLASELCTLLVQTQVYFVTTEWHKTKVYVSHPRLDITQTSVNCFKLSVLLFRLLHIFDQASTPRGWW